MSSKLDDRLKRRNSMRRPNHDYSLPGSYFVTICVQDRRHAFGTVVNDEMFLSEAGHRADACLRDLEQRFPTVLVDCHIVMPNHVHALLVLGAREFIAGEEGAMNRAATVGLGSPRGVNPKLGDIVRVFKATSKRAIRTRGHAGFAWQSDYHDRIVRTERELGAIRAYVVDNPSRWVDDTFNGVALVNP